MYLWYGRSKKLVFRHKIWSYKIKSVASILLPIQKMKRNIYLLLISTLSPQIWSAICTCIITSCKYLFSYLIYKIMHVLKIWPVTVNFLPTQNITSDVYLPLIFVFLPIIQSATCTCNMANYKYLFSQS